MLNSFSLCAAVTWRRVDMVESVNVKQQCSVPRLEMLWHFAQVRAAEVLPTAAMVAAVAAVAAMVAAVAAVAAVALLLTVHENTVHKYLFSKED